MQVSAYMARRAARKGAPARAHESESLKAVRTTLRACCNSPTLTIAAKTFLCGLLGIVDACIVVPGRASPSRKTVRRIVLHYATFELPSLYLRQQRLIRKHYGSLLSLDGTFKVAASLVGADSDAPNARGKAKLKSYSSVCLTVCVEHGLVVAAALVPDERQVWAQATLTALANGELPNDSSKAMQRVHRAAAVGGPLRQFPRLLLTDNIGKDINLWARVAQAYVAGCLKHDVVVMIPQGALRRVLDCRQFISATP